MIDFGIDYATGITYSPSAELEGTIAFLLEELPWRWCEVYDDMVGGRSKIGQFNDGSFEVLFDHGSEAEAVLPEERVDDRVVAVFGCSKQVNRKRDASRMRGFLRGANLNRPSLIDTVDTVIPMDRGHFLAHTLGGSTDVNLFPQRRDVNRGWSARGKIYRRMERYCAEHPGTFCFSRPIYRDRSWVPFEIEYGLLRGPRDLWVERFEN